MSTQPVKTNGTPRAQAYELALINNDLSKLSSDERLAMVGAICDSTGLNKLTSPLQFINLNGKLTLYATRTCTDQLRKIHGVSLQIVARERIGELYAVTARATDKTGRTDESTGAVVLGALRGDALANAIMKAETKAKRRVTLSICGLGVLDESELDTIPGARPVVEPPPPPPPISLEQGGTWPAVDEVAQPPAPDDLPTMPVDPGPGAPRLKPATDKQIKYLGSLLDKAGVDGSQHKQALKAMTGYDDLSSMTVSRAIEKLKAGDYSALGAFREGSFENDSIPDWEHES